MQSANLTDKPTIQEVIPMIKSYKEIEGHRTGGALHIVLDDGNIKDSSVRWCINEAYRNHDPEGVELGKTLLKMSKTQRKKLADMFYSL